MLPLAGILITTILQFWPHSVDNVDRSAKEIRNFNYEAVEVSKILEVTCYNQSMGDVAVSARGL